MERRSIVFDRRAIICMSEDGAGWHGNPRQPLEYQSTYNAQLRHVLDFVPPSRQNSLPELDSEQACYA
jgi:hypothetical protein